MGKIEDLKNTLNNKPLENEETKGQKKASKKKQKPAKAADSNKAEQ